MEEEKLDVIFGEGFVPNKEQQRFVQMAVRAFDSPFYDGLEFRPAGMEQGALEIVAKRGGRFVGTILLPRHQRELTDKQVATLEKLVRTAFERSEEHASPAYAEMRNGWGGDYHAWENETPEEKAALLDAYTAQLPKTGPDLWAERETHFAVLAGHWAKNFDLGELVAHA